VVGYDGVGRGWCAVRQVRRMRMSAHAQHLLSICGLVRRTSGIQGRIRSTAKSRRPLVLVCVLRLLLCVLLLLSLLLLPLPLRHGHVVGRRTAEAVRRRQHDRGSVLPR
jgi:hypothetical protein